MPYKIRKLPKKNLYKVYDNKGVALSKKGMTKENAQKQIVAVYLSKERKKKGKGAEVFKRA